MSLGCFFFSFQAQYSHHVIQEILGHLDARKKDSPRVRAGIIQVLLEAVAIAAKGSIGECLQKNRNRATTAALICFRMFSVDSTVYAKPSENISNFFKCAVIFCC